MKISNIKIYRVEGGGLRPVLVEIETDEGISGFGEAGVAYGYGAPAVAGMLEDMALQLSGRNPLEIRRIWQDLYDHSFWAKGGGAISFAAISAIELALWDIKGKAAGLPVHELLGGAVRTDIKVYANGWNHEHDDVVSWAKAAGRPLADGYHALKAYPFAYELPDGTFRHVSARMLDDGRFRQAIERVKALRAEVGPDIELMLDLSGGLCDDQLLRFLDVCRDLDITWIEEPVDPFNLTGLSRVAARSGIPIALGERVYGRSGFRNVLDTGAVSIVMPDVANCGGMLEAVQIAGMAETYNVRVSPHNCASSLCTAASLSLCAAIPNAMNLEVYPYFADSNTYVQVLENPPEQAVRRDGKLQANSMPGLGITVDRRRIEGCLSFALV
ncbi:mandelate racemase/muconate lactonizing enzyme family protein [Rhizobium sp. GN54]|uniref:mandelate racemase/muconate lactonizing enzyme family protein n=1 Tax=Rhizobium sp. GN54 TaxID=2898150 RepID=UPI001E323A88|nr:mandelate racemase/muconate lactonizing enzyme family protein [Rhizobium sp. GN54]MCD2184800.1 mandelate racemase/muconate lactonizing enzyme family protein [Rhizobium sp. GN54]